MVSPRIAAVVAAAALSFGSLSMAGAAQAHPKPEKDHEKPAACAKQTAQVEKAQKALDKVNAVFAKQDAKVKKAKKAVTKADKRSERAKAKKSLKSAKAKRTITAKSKKAQVKRLEHATKRLTTCLAAQPEVNPAPAA